MTDQVWGRGGQPRRRRSLQLELYENLLLMVSDTASAQASSSSAEFREIVLAFLDVLGFSERVRRLGLAEIHRQYEELIALVKQKTEGRVIVAAMPTGDGSLGLMGGYRQLEHAYFSDTILLWARYESPLMESFLDSVLQFFCEALARGIPIRGCIAFGKALMDRERGVFLGEPIIEGYRGEAAQNWLGVSFGPSLEQSPYGWVGTLHHVIPFDRHIKPGKERLITQLVLDWPRRWREDYAAHIGSDASTQVNLLNNDPRFASYYQQALKLVDISDRETEWWKTTDLKSLPISFGGHMASPKDYWERSG